MPVVFYVTCANRGEALHIARTCVEERLAACANLIGPVRSVFRWDGEVRQAEETVLILKTGEERVDALTARIRALHSYECPCIVCWPLTGGAPDFLEWVRHETG